MPFLISKAKWFEDEIRIFQEFQTIPLPLTHSQSDFLVFQLPLKCESHPALIYHLHYVAHDSSVRRPGYL